MNLIKLKCLLHGEYEKSKDDLNKTCPTCAKQRAEQKKPETPTLKSELLQFETVINCEVHGETILNVPSLLNGIKHSCPKCMSEKRQGKITNHMKRVFLQECKNVNIPDNFVGKKFSDVDRAKSLKQTKIIERMRSYVFDMADKGESVGAKNLVFSGNMGTGKTLFASILLQNIIKRSFVSGINDESDISLKGGLSCLFISEQELINTITESWSKQGETSKKLLDRLCRKSVLCIDDVGTVTSMQTHLLDAYAVIFDERYKRNLPTIITTNMGHESIKNAIGIRANDRFMEKNKIIIASFDWGSYRTADFESNDVEFL